MCSYMRVFTVGHFPITLSVFKGNIVVHFHMNGYAPCLALIKGQWESQKWASDRLA